ncbi:CAMK family protein kinase [Tritrichomonas foetus]|uniref:CAMK family protein kinase n=1 Tax=Tritrichomonas foetus TaxID=1144522 RepID=A0A1J4J9L6_9EUKA|nr:CAMK family protein kinase [Tritrichomonas foetus]|eukprot:OHS94125.1 CAMK family protein kinase [Tritrichomonas foetus]
MSIPKHFGGHYSITKIISAGSTCVMALGEDERAQKTVAVKVMSRKDSCSKDKIDSEISILKRIDKGHPNIVKIYDVINFEDLVLIVMEYCSNGDLFELIVNSQIQSVSTKKKILKGIFGAIEYLHKECGISHCDIKAENIVLNERFEPKLTDFGNAKAFEIGGDEAKDGTLLYAAPELLTGDTKFNTRKVDIYALGILMCTLFTGEFPYAAMSDDEHIIKQIIKGRLMFPQKMNRTLKAFARRCTNIEPLKRPTIEEIVNFEWLDNIHHNQSISTEIPNISKIERLNQTKASGNVNEL